jgi:hypothetical protein
MEDKLKIKVTIGEISIELEGSTNVVLEKFEELKTSGLGNLIPSQNLFLSKPKVENKQVDEGNKNQTVVPQEVKSNSNSSYPSLREINLKGSPKNEPEWILVYGFYASDYGKDEFVRERLIQFYKDTKRETKSRIANLSNNLKNLLKQGKLRFLNDNDIVLTPEGVAAVEEIIKR